MAAPLLKLIPPWTVLAVLAAWLWTGAGVLLAVWGLVAVVELMLWFARVARAQSLQAQRPAAMERVLGTHPLAVAVLLVVFGVLIDVARVVAAVGRFVWWFTLYPTLVINRQRHERARAAKLHATAQAVIRAATSPPEVAAGTSLQERARKVLAQPLGLREAPLPAPPAQLETQAVQVLEIEEPASVAVLHGLVTTWADGRHQFDPLGGG